MRRLLAFAISMLAFGCGAPEPVKPDPAPPASAKVESLPIQFVPAPDAGEVKAQVQAEYQKAKAEGRQLLVYVGAKWCEPCQRFHDAATAGKLNDAFPGVRLVEYDLDRDRDRLIDAGYGSKMIPLFALPREDGAPAGPRIEGSIKGPGAVAQITPRLREVLAGRSP